MRALAALVTVTLVAGMTVALSESGTEDGDYPDLCDGYAVAAVGEPVDGALAPPDDEADHIGLDVTERDVGVRLTVSYVADTHRTNLEVLTPDCGQDVVPVPHQACTKAQCPKGHENGRGKGHEMCMGRGHLSECTGSEGGTADEDSVSFTPTQVGVYVVRVTVDARAFHEPGGDCRWSKDCGGTDPCQDCVCVECYDGSPSGGDGASTSGSDGPTVQHCHQSCEGALLGYAIESTRDDTTAVQ